MLKFVSCAAVAMLAGTAMAQSYTLHAEPIPQGTYVDRGPGVIYSAMAGPFQAFPAAAGNLGFDDYDSILPGGQDNLTALRFVGGVTQVGGIIDFNFLDVASAPVSSFAVQFPQAGNFIWTITLGAPVVIHDQGFLQLSTRAGVTGQWFLSTTAPSIGTESRALGDTTTHGHNFELTVPAPGSLALLGLGGLIAGRRRR